MSQWNNSYTYNNQYQAPNNWNGDPNGQYIDQMYHNNRQYNSNNQYVSFNEFITQIQSNSSAPSHAGSYSNQYSNNQVNQYDVQSPQASTSNTAGGSNHYEIPPPFQNGIEKYPIDDQASQGPSSSNVNDIVTKSNLTPTATEFVPKNSKLKSSNSSKSVPGSSTNNRIREVKSNHSNANELNWRSRPQSSYDSTSSRSKKDIRNNQTDNHRSHNNYNKDSYNYESRRSNQEAENMNHNSNHISEGSYYNKDKNGDRQKERSQLKSNLKPKNKENNLTFYNSTIAKGNDVRHPRGESSKSKNWIGSQRLQQTERNTVEDEQYANSYLKYREEKFDNNYKEAKASPIRKNKYINDQVIKELTQRERLSEQLDKGTLECLVCCERVKQMDSIWWCMNCYHVLHLRCIRKWAMSSLVEGKWRCPACQNTSDTIPTEYRCLCGAVRSPEWSRGAGAHTCGQPCRRTRSCVHPCTLLCHPGPCPPCQATVTKQCGCGAETRSVLCSSKLPQECGRVCGRQLTCGVHTCARTCHEGPCDPCTDTVTQVCYCPASASRSVPCTTEWGWSCGASCGRVLACGAHVCRRTCHQPPCDECTLRPENVKTCPCGRTKLEEGKRKKCTDPIPLCENICAKPLSCGPDGDKHFCKLNCHEGPCPVCPDKTVLQCRCGHTSREVPCSELPQMYNNVLCQKKCNKKLSCGRHRCRATCCSGSAHRCGVVCGRALSCQLHRCEEFCHTGHCSPCPRLGFEELRCECGLQVLLPPIRCGARPPPCTAPCRRRRECGHEPHHACHTGPCPPCVVLTAKVCHGGHEERKTIPCSQEEFSCGLPCGKPLPCGKHTCIKICHKGPCDTEKCTQPCNEKRPSCGHPCAAPCHEPPCPVTPCRRAVTATCPCRRRSAEKPCAENMRDYARIMSTIAASKMQEGGSVDISEVQRPDVMLRTLDCDDECRVEARTRQMALALQIRNPDVSAKLAPRYGDHVRALATREPAFARHVHDKLSELVQLAKKSKQKTRSHSFPSMNWQKRQFIHELCEHFGCESVAYDAEPNRNVVATADREKSWLPAMSILEVLAREAGRRKVPPPMLRSPATGGATGPGPTTVAAPSVSKPASWAALTSGSTWAARAQAKPVEKSDSKIDYFDNPPDN